MRLGDWLLPGATVMVFGTLGAMLIQSGSIKNDIETRSLVALNERGHDWVRIVVDGRDVTIGGTAPTPEAREAARAVVDGVFGVRVVLSEADVLQEQKPYELTLSRTGNTVTVSGFTPSKAGRAALLGVVRAALPGSSVSDGTALARGMPDGFEAAVAYAGARLANLDPGEVTLKGLSLSISGESTSLEGYATITEALDGDLPKGLTIDRREISIPTVSPYTWAVEKTASGLAISGFVPSEDARAAILTAAGGVATDAPVLDRMIVANGAPEGVDWPEMAAYALSRVASMSTGEASVSDSELTIVGEAAVPGEFEALAPRFRADPPDGIVVVRSSILAPLVAPYLWTAETRGQDIVLSGFVPDNNTRDQVVQFARERVSGKVVDEMRIGRGAPLRFVDVVDASLASISRLEDGKAALAGTSVTISGAALHVKAKNDLEARIRDRLPAGMSGAPVISVKPPASPVAGGECATLLSSTLQTQRIEYAVGKADISSNSHGLLDVLVFLAQRCPDARFAIDGHTDSDGSETLNQQLSEARAGSVKAYLVDAGVSATRLEARGFGESRPLVSNDSDRGKALNRRIEFSLLPGG